MNKLAPLIPALIVLAVLHPASRRVLEGIRETQTLSVRQGQQVRRGLARFIRN